jgi:hypothetical protein
MVLAINQFTSTRRRASAIFMIFCGQSRKVPSKTGDDFMIRFLHRYNSRAILHLLIPILLEERARSDGLGDWSLGRKLIRWTEKWKLTACLIFSVREGINNHLCLHRVDGLGFQKRDTSSPALLEAWRSERLETGAAEHYEFTKSTLLHPFISQDNLHSDPVLHFAPFVVPSSHALLRTTAY